MNTNSYERELQQVEAPAPDPAARERARRAALEEFQRIHAAPAAPAGNVTTLHRSSRWNPRSQWFSGLAAASLAVLGVAVYWLLPDEERVVRTTPALTAATTGSGIAESDGSAAVADTTAQSAQPPVRPVQVQPPPAPRMELPPVDMPRPEESFARASQESRKTDARATTALTNAAERPAPAAVGPSVPPPAPPPGISAGLTDEVAEVAVTGSRVVRRDLQTSSPIVVIDAGSLITPTVENRDRFEHFEVNPVKLTREEPVSTFSADVDTASYSFVRRQLNDGVLPPADAVRVEEMINYFDYDWPVPGSRSQPFRPTITVSDSPWGEGRKLVHIGIKGYELPAAERPDVNLVLLMDVSGSMNSPDKLPLAQRSMALLLDSLKPTDTVAIVVYAGAAGQVLAPTPVREKQTILDALNSLRPGGSTAGAAGIQLAYQLAERSFRKAGVNRILLATDGDFNVGISDREQLKGFVEREREKGVFLSVLGFGQGNYRDEMAQALAQNGNGVAAYIDTLNEARKVLVEQAGGALFTIAKDVKLQVEFNPAAVAEYRLVGYETRALNREDFNNDKVDAGDVGAGHAVTAIYEITPVGSRGRMFEDSRYAERDNAAARRTSPTGEYGFLKIRYKLPDSTRSRLIEAPIRADAGVPAALRQDVAFSTAVAGFGQLLRGGRYTGTLRYEDVLRQAQGARGEDPFGYRAEFVQLVRRAQTARGM